MANLGLDPERLSSIDEFGDRKHIIPAEVKGRYRRARTWVQGFLIFIFLALPWIKIDGKQALLFEITERHFVIFGLELYAHDAPLIFFLLGLGVLGLALVTAVWGRAWCGWACPQTVFIDGVFRRIEVWVEGNYRERRKMAASPLTFAIFKKRALKWFLFIVVSSFIAHSFAAYFAGADRLLAMMGASPFANWSYFLLISSFTAVILFDFAWFREQFCIIMCPYGRFQGLLMDNKSLAVMYDEKRGEPRRGTQPRPEKFGDCISCNRCVEVCPTGIDIRKGVQMECIACTACMDACDEMMTKVRKPTKLIRYASASGPSWTLRSPRTILNIVLMILLGTGLIVTIATRAPVELVVLRAPGELFQKVGAGGETLIVNHLKLHLRNQSGKDLRLTVRAVGPEDRELRIATPENPFTLKAGEDNVRHIFVSFPPAAVLPVEIQLTDPAHPDIQTRKAYLLQGPTR